MEVRLDVVTLVMLFLAFCDIQMTTNTHSFSGLSSTCVLQQEGGRPLLQPRRRHQSCEKEMWAVHSLLSVNSFAHGIWHSNLICICYCSDAVRCYAGFGQCTVMAVIPNLSYESDADIA